MKSSAFNECAEGFYATKHALTVSGKAMTTQPDRQIGFFLTFHILAIA